MMPFGIGTIWLLLLLSISLLSLDPIEAFVLSRKNPLLRSSRLFASVSIQNNNDNNVPTRRNKNKKNKPKRSSKPNQSFRNKPANIPLETQLYYARNGHAVLRGLVPPSTLQALLPPIQRFCREQALSAYQQKVLVAATTTPQSEPSAKALALSCTTIPECQEQLKRLLQKTTTSDTDIALPFLQYFNLWTSFDDVYQLALFLSPTAAQLLNVPSVRLYQDAVFWKRTVDGGTPWHADLCMAPFDTNHYLTVWIPLHTVTQSGLLFCSQTHTDVALPYWREDRLSEINLEERYRHCDTVHHMPLACGDVTVHSGWTLHTADPCQNEDRLALAISFVDSRAPIRKNCLSSGDDEDRASYEGWIGEVPRETTQWDHALAPIVWPPEKRTIKKRRKSHLSS